MTEQQTTTVKVANGDDLTNHFNRNYNYAGVMADIALHIEIELDAAAKDNRVPWGVSKVESIQVDGDDVIRFDGIKPVDQPEGFDVSHSVEIIRINAGNDEHTYVERINLLINGSLFGQFTHVSREQIYQLAETGLATFNNPTKMTAGWRN